MENNNKLSVLTKGIVKENPVLRLVLGTCPTLAVTTSAINGIGMGVAATLVLIGSNVAISLLRRVIPNRVRIPAFITIIATFVTIVQMLVKAFLPSVDKALGIFLPLIVVNCIILARAEMFASKNSVLPSILDAVGMGIGFTAALTLMGMIRELFGAGTVFGLSVTRGAIEPMLVFILPPGGFFVFGVLVALSNKLAVKMGKKPVKNMGCGSCNVCGGCDSESMESEDIAPADEGIVANADIAKEQGEEFNTPDEVTAVSGDGTSDIEVRTEASSVERVEDGGNTETLPDTDVLPADSDGTQSVEDAAEKAPETESLTRNEADTKTLDDSDVEDNKGADVVESNEADVENESDRATEESENKKDGGEQ